MSELRLDRVDAGRLRASGALGFTEARAAFARGDALAEGGAREVDLDVAGLEHVDSATLAVLLAWAARAAQRGTRVRLVAVPDGLRALAHLSDAEGLLGIA